MIYESKPCKSSCTVTVVSSKPDIPGSYQCPTCFGHFTLGEIEGHADACAQALVDPIGECEGELNLSDDENDVMKDAKTVPEKEDTNTGSLIDIKGAVTNLKCVLESSAITNRISIRRSCPFRDYATARGKRWFKP